MSPLTKEVQIGKDTSVKLWVILTLAASLGGPVIYLATWMARVDETVASVKEATQAMLKTAHQNQSEIQRIGTRVELIDKIGSAPAQLQKRALDDFEKRLNRIELRIEKAD